MSFVTALAISRRFSVRVKPGEIKCCRVPPNLGRFITILKIELADIPGTNPIYYRYPRE